MKRSEKAEKIAVMLEELYPELATNDSPTQRVGGAPLKEFKQIKHPVRMLSIEDIHELKEEQLIDGNSKQSTTLLNGTKKR